MYQIKFELQAERDLKKLPNNIRNRVADFLNERVAPHPDPKVLAKSMQGDHKGLWRFRVGDYRLICDIQTEEITILVIRIGHRREIYD